MCDTLCRVSAGRTLFAKNSDRPPGEVQVVEAHASRPAAAFLRTQYLEIDDGGAAALLGSRPTWLWGLEHGVNEHRVAVGNEKVWTTSDPHTLPPALIGMDLVRLGLERGHSAESALDHVTSLLQEHGQGGAGEEDGECYFSSFLVADPAEAWILETSGRTWAARHVADAAAISNRISLSGDWTRASPDVAAGADFQQWRHPAAPTGHADVRLAASRSCLATRDLTPRTLAAHLRHHGERPWGAPGDDPSDVSPVPGPVASPDGEGISVCMHVRGYQATTASMIAELPQDPAAPLRAWVALGSPCASAYVPVFPPDGVPRALADADSWHRFAALRDRVEAEPSALADVRAVLGPVEAELWDEADAVADDPRARGAFVAGAWSRVEAALGKLGQSASSTSAATRSPDRTAPSM